MYQHIYDLPFVLILNIYGHYVKGKHNQPGSCIPHKNLFVIAILLYKNAIFGRLG